MRKLKLQSSGQEVEMMVCPSIERMLATARRDIGKLCKNIPEYHRIEPDVKESVKVFKHNTEFFKEKIEGMKSTLKMAEEEIKVIARTQKEFLSLAKEINGLASSLMEIEAKLEWNVSVFYNSDFFELYFGKDGFYTNSEKLKVKSEE